ncbi:MAG: glycosyltransferase family 87 protein [Crocinitomicaceae bacterium]
MLLDIVKYCTIFLAGLFLVFRGIIPGWEELPADFNNYYVASKLVVKGEAVHQFYDNDWFNSHAKKMGIEAGAKFAPFPPPTAYLLIPLTVFNPLTAKRIWLVINCLLLFLIVLKTKRHFKTNAINALLFVSLFTLPIANCISFGQIYLLLAFILVHTVLSNNYDSKFIWPAIFFGITTAIKYVPILFATYFYKNVSKTKLWALTFCVILIVFALIFIIDPLAYNQFIRTLSSHLNGNLSGQGKYAIGFQSLDSLLNNLFVMDDALNPFPIINIPILKPILKFSIALGIGVILFFLLKKSSYKLNPILISIGIVGSFIIFPATASYHFLLLFLPILFISKWLLSFSVQYITFLIAIVVTFTVQYHHIPALNSLPTFNLLIHYPRFWCLLFVFLFLIFNYLKLNTSKHG